jgi:hypothetical protein
MYTKPDLYSQCAIECHLRQSPMLMSVPIILKGKVASDTAARICALGDWRRKSSHACPGLTVTKVVWLLG